MRREPHLESKALDKQPAIEAVKKKLGINKESIQAFFPSYVYLNHDVLRDFELNQAKVERAVATYLQSFFLKEGLDILTVDFRDFPDPRISEERKRVMHSCDGGA